MGSANNPDTYGQSTTGTANQIEDGVDFPHSGIIKALSDGMGQNYAMDGFDISSTNATALTVAAGKIFRDGQFVAVSGASLTLSSTYTNGYHLLVAPSGGTPTVVLRNPSAIDKVPDITSGDTIIAVITHTGVNPCSIQFLTVHKREHSLSIGRDNSSVYTEGLTIKSNAGDIEIESLEQDKDIIFKVNDGGSTKDRLILYGDNDSSYPNTEVKIDGSLLATEDIQANKLVVGYANTPSSGAAEIVSFSNSEPMVFKTGSQVERMRIDTAGNVGIGTNSPSELLHVKGNVLIEDGAGDGNDHLLEIKSGSSADNARLIISSDTDVKLALIHLRDVEENSGTFSTHYSAYIALDRASAIMTGSAQNDLLIANGNHNKNIHLCTNPTSAGTQAQAKMTIAADGDVGIGTTTPSEKLDVQGNISTSGNVVVGGLQYSQFKDLTGDLATGWHSIALIEGRSGGSASGTGGSSQRGIGTFFIRNTDSSRHQTTILTASHLFGAGNGNGISIEHSSYFSTIGIDGFRLKESSTYDGAVLQINIADATNDIEVYLKNNFQYDGWVLIQAVADASDPSTGSLGLGYNNAYSTFSASATTSITGIAALGQHIQGQLSVGDIKTVNGVEINGALNHDGSTAGFFGATPITKITVGNIAAPATINPDVPNNPSAAEITSTQAAILALENKLDAVIDALQALGLMA